MIRVVLPSASSRLHTPVMLALGMVNAIPPKKLYVKKNSLHLYFLRGWDIPSTVSRGLVDYGICGYDCVVESKKDVEIIEQMSVRRSRIILSARKDNPPFVALNPVVATEYPNIAAEYFAAKKLSPTIIQIKGAGEAYPHLPGVDLLLDLTTSGESLVENELTELDEILVTDACLIRARTAKLVVQEFSVQELREILKREFEQDGLS